MNLKYRISLLEKDINSKINISNSRNQIGSILDISIDEFVSLLDILFNEDSIWDSFTLDKKHEVVFQFNFKPGFTVPDYAEILKSELRSSIKAVFEIKAKLLIENNLLNKFEKNKLTEDEIRVYSKSFNEEMAKIKGKFGIINKEGCYGKSN